MNSKDHLVTLERCGFFICSPVDSVRPFTIPSGEEYVEILAGGKLFFEVDGREKEMTPGTVFWHIAGEKTICRTSAKDPYRCYVFHFRVNDFCRPAPRVSCWRDEKSVLEFSSDCLHTYQKGGYDRELFAQYVYSTLRWHALTDHISRNEYPVPLCNALLFMEKNFSSPELSAALIAENAGISRPYLFDLCRNFLGESPCMYLQKKRVEHAGRLLMTTALPIKDIAERCGFASIEVFYRVFRKYRGTTPGNYREVYNIYPR